MSTLDNPLVAPVLTVACIGISSNMGPHYIPKNTMLLITSTPPKKFGKPYESLYILLYPFITPRFPLKKPIVQP